MDAKWTKEQIFEDKAENKIFGIGYSFNKSKVRLKGRGSKKFIFTFVIALVALVFLIGNLTNNVISASTTSNVSLEIVASDYFGISIANFASKELALECANEIQKLGGAGYIYQKDKSFFVLTSVYEENDSALSVANKLTNLKYKPSIIQLYTNGIDYSKIASNLTLQEKENLSQLLKIFDDSFLLLTEISNNVDKNEITIPEGKQKILETFNLYSKLHKNYLVVFENNTQSEIVKLTDALHKVLNQLELLSLISTDNNLFTSNIKRGIVDIVITKCDLTN